MIKDKKLVEVPKKTQKAFKDIEEKAPELLKELEPNDEGVLETFLDEYDEIQEEPNSFMDEHCLLEELEMGIRDFVAKGLGTVPYTTKITLDKLTKLREGEEDELFIRNVPEPEEGIK